MGKYIITHRTRYIYSQNIKENAFKLALYPIADKFMRVQHHLIRVMMDPEIQTFEDFNGNTIGTFSLFEPHREIIIDSILHTETEPRAFPNTEVKAEEEWKKIDEINKDSKFFDFLQTEDFEGSESVRNYLNEIDKQQVSPYELVLRLNSYINELFTYTKGVTHVHSGLDEVWKIKAGVCQDYAHILLEFLRLSGIPARYVSGYICPIDHDMIGDGATHAWVEAYIPGFGWTGIDPTNNCVADDKHVRIATGRQYADCPPVAGVYRGTANNILEVNVSVEYNPEAWNVSAKPLKPEVLPKRELRDIKENMEAMQQQQQQQ